MPLYFIEKVAIAIKTNKRLRQATKIALLFLMRVFFKNSPIVLRFLLETARCALVANALCYKIAFSATPEFENSLVAEN